MILDDAGYSLTELQPFLELPGPLTVAVLPDLPHSAEAARRVLAAGKDLILHCPMEADGDEDPGPGALRVGMSEEQIDRILSEDFASVPGAVGMNNHMGSRATADPALMETVLGYLKREGLFFVDSRTTAETVGPEIARRLGVPFLQRNLFIDDERNEKSIADAFNVGVREARTRGTAVVIGHVQNKAVLDILRTGRRELAGNGVRLARLEEIMSETRVVQQGRDRTGSARFLKILGIESSCDECSAAVVEDGRRILSNIVLSQVDFHRPFYGVVPEIASRKHVEWISPVVQDALSAAGVAVRDIDAVAVTYRPGLIGSLLVGLSFAKGLAWALGKPFVGVDHILAHLYAPHLENDIPYPYLGVLVSGGHTIIARVDGHDRMRFLAPRSMMRAAKPLTRLPSTTGSAFPGALPSTSLPRPGIHGRSDSRIPSSTREKRFMTSPIRG